MNKKILIAYVVGALGFLYASGAYAAIGQGKMKSARTSTSSAQWAGVYQGVLPCTVCNGARTQLILQPNGQYVLRETWVGRADVLNTQAGGWFKWSADKRQVILDRDGDLRRFMIGNGFVEERTAADGSPLHGKRATTYVLKKVS
ncbi:copper resistance protein NlpE [Snodgrassella sp. CFCC 13594]|uniref:copper resistance protein NlpE n=1 Tax=Snodgrassella sp. CFCC 13594 TaxID=1775559 RepID=UPI0008295A4C|nr:copper resistance protein NlpE N-terminal domain-containing protein [Snodgrassella sp. CFCC 13594]